MNRFKSPMMVFLFLVLSPIAHAYELTVIKVDGYSKPIVLLTAGILPIESVQRVHLHLHGWTQDPKSGKSFRQNFDFDWKDGEISPSESDLRRFIEAYSIHKTSESFPDRAVLIPIARGHCDQYPELTKDFDGILRRIFEVVGMKSDRLAIESASAHSGGGEVLSNLLQSSSLLQKAARVFMIDAIYHDGTRDRLNLWVGTRVEGVTRTLEMLVIPNQAPQKYGSQILDSFSGAPKRLEFQWVGSSTTGTEKTSATGNSMVIFQESKPRQLDHWTIVKTHFEMSLNPEIKRKPSSKKSSR